MIDHDEVYATAGDVVTCENGHEIATFVEDALRHRVPTRKLFDWREGAEPPLDSSYSSCKCHVCGADYIKCSMTAGVVLHFARDGWRATYPREFGIDVS